MTERLESRATLVQNLASSGASAPEIVAALEDPTYRVHLDLTDGSTFGEALPPGQSNHYRYTKILLDLPSSPLDKAQVTVWTASNLVTDEVRALDRQLIAVSLGALLIAGLLIVITVDVALKPLTTMADRARRVSQGERGIRMGSPTASTEVGRAATAIDDMLDELEGAMGRASEAERRAEMARVHMQQFLADAAHELKTPIAGIQAAAEALVQVSVDDDPVAREDLSFLLGREAHRAGQLVNSLLEVARIDSGVVLADETVDLDDLLLAERTRISLSRPQVAFSVSVAEPLVVRGDRRALTSALRNVIENATRAASPQGWVAVSLTRRDLAEGQGAVITVADSGSGIPESDRERVFERLVRLSDMASTEPGSGLGLAIARGYARAHGGEVRHATASEIAALPLDVHGAVFVIELPLGDAGIHQM